MKLINADRLLFMKADLSGLIENNPDPNSDLWEKGYQACLENVQKQVNDAPIVDTQPVVHGQWVVIKVNGTSTMFACSECGREVEATNDYFRKPTKHIAKNYPYCHCGAKMEQKEG